MLLTEILQGLQFYLIASLFALIGFPFARRIFTNQMLAFAVAKILGLIIFGYFIWFLASVRLLNYQAHGIILLLFLCAAILGIVGVVKWHQKKSQEQLQDRITPVKFWKCALTLELLGLLAFVAYLILRSHNAAANGTERFMDMALLAAASKTNYFPFIDPWYAGHTVNYYYYGSYLISLLGNISRIPTALVYNFAIGLIYSNSLILSGSVIWALSKSKKMAMFGAILLTSCGTLFFANCAMQKSFLHPTQTCSFPSSTRLYTPSYMINEIPSYSFTVGDLHAHLLALPFFLLALALAYALFEYQKPHALLAVLISLSLATSGLINAWDLITLSCLLILILLYKLWQSKSDKKTFSNWIYFGLGVSVITGLLMYPALRNFHNPVLGLGFIPSFVREHALNTVQWPTPITAELGMWGILILGALCAFFLERKKMKDINFLLILSTLSLGIIVGVELFFIRDIYSVSNPPYFRANTTFKFGYHAWSMLCIVFAAGLGKIFTSHLQFKRRTLRLANLLTFIAIGGGLIYPYAAIAQFYANTQDKPTLNAGKWMQNQTPEDFAIVEFINKNIPGRVVIAEAVGDSYTTFSRITTFSGNITPMGWSTHEWTWRFQGEAAKHAKIGEQVETGWTAISIVMGDIKTLYETSDLTTARKILQQYGIEYVYVGQLERTTYKNLNEQKFNTLGKPIFRSGSSTLYKITPL